MERHHRYYDWPTLILLFLLTVFGLFILLTVNSSLFSQQFLYAIIGAVLLFLISRIDSAILIWFVPFGYVTSILFLILSYFGPAVRGAHRWIMIGPQQIQPSELVKPILLLVFAYAITKFPPKKIPEIIFHFILFLFPFILVFKQPDLGTSLVYVAMWVSMMIMGGFPLALFFGGIGLGVAGSPILWRVLASYQKSRILTFLNPMLDPQGTGYNAIQAIIAIGSGQWFGRGLGLGTQSHLRFLPEYYTDFMFATLVEELGFVGGAALLALYTLLLWNILKPLIKTTISGRLPVIYTIGLFTMLLTQIAINSGMNMGILPITGITLPLVSYGGSSLLSIAITFGILWAIAFE
jgi:rod shape determining protein RodA